MSQSVTSLPLHAPHEVASEAAVFVSAGQYLCCEPYGICWKPATHGETLPSGRVRLTCASCARQGQASPLALASQPTSGSCPS